MWPTLDLGLPQGLPPSVFPTLPSSWALSSASSAQNTSRTGVSGGPSLPTRMALLSSRWLCPPRDLLDGWAQRAAHPAHQGDAESGQDAAPTSSLRRGTRCTLLTRLPAPGWTAGCPSPGSGAAATRCQTPWGTEPYTSTSACPALHLCPLSPLQETPHFMPHPPFLHLGPLAASGVGLRRRDSHPLATRALLPAAPGGGSSPVP